MVNITSSNLVEPTSLPATVPGASLAERPGAFRVVEVRRRACADLVEEAVGGTDAPERAQPAASDASEGPAEGSAWPRARFWPSRATWTSLLQPGRRPSPLARLDWLLLAGSYLLAFALRWDLRSAQPYV